MNTTTSAFQTRLDASPVKSPTSSPWLAVGLAFVFAPIMARAAYHLWDIDEVYSSADGSVQFIELRALSSGQTVMSGNVTIRATNSGVVKSFVCNSNLPIDTANRTCLFGTTNLANVPGGVVPNYIIPPNFIPRTGNGAVLFLPGGFPGQNVAAVYSSLPTDGDSALRRSGGSFITVATNSPKNLANQSNSIVPVKFLGVNATTNNLVMAFRTATGVNGSAGPNYAVEGNYLAGTTNWTVASNGIAGNGTVKAVAIPMEPATNKIFRLRSP